MTRKEKIEKLLDDVHSWDLDALVGYVQDNLEQTYKFMSDQDLDAEYSLSFSGLLEDFDDLLDDPEEFDLELEDEPTPTIELCPNCGREKDIGCKCWWCGLTI